ncbi:MAG: hypothetical protein GY801_19615 [bacterium]|nr:hypothetical protein [bacterium]
MVAVGVAGVAVAGLVALGRGGGLQDRAVAIQYQIERVVKEQPEKMSEFSEDLDWSRHTSKHVSVEWTPGTHLTMFNEPHVQKLAAQLHPSFRKLS